MISSSAGRAGGGGNAGRAGCVGTAVAVAGSSVGEGIVVSVGSGGAVAEGKTAVWVTSMARVGWMVATSVVAVQAVIPENDKNKVKSSR